MNEHMILQDAPPLLKYSECALRIFTHRLQSLTEALRSFRRGILVRTLHHAPLVVASIAYEIETQVRMRLTV